MKTYNISYRIPKTACDRFPSITSMTWLYLLVCGSIHRVRTQDSYAGLHPGTRYHILRLIICACRTVWFGRFRRIRDLHNFRSKKSTNYLWGVKLQHKVPSIFVHDKIFENSSQTQRTCKRIHSIPYVYLCESFVFASYFRTFCPEQKYLGFYVVALLPINRFLIFWT